MYVIAPLPRNLFITLPAVVLMEVAAQLALHTLSSAVSMNFASFADRPS